MKINVTLVGDILEGVEVNILLYLILFDIFLGITKSCINKKLNSHVGLQGLLKHSLIIIIVISLGVVAEPLEINVVFTGMVIFYIIQYLLSITENLDKIGVPLPKFVTDKIAKLDGENERYKRRL